MGKPKNPPLFWGLSELARKKMGPTQAECAAKFGTDITLRDLFAAFAIFNGDSALEKYIAAKVLAESAYKLADAMLEARQR